jgi:hypothetical protein
MNDEITRELLDHVGITRVQQAYADIASRRAWNELDEVFLPETRIVVAIGGDKTLTFTGPEPFAEFVGPSVDQFEFFEFVILNSRIFTSVDGDPDAATARMWMCELREFRDSGRWSVAYGIYHDRFRRIDGRWWFTTREYQTLARTALDGPNALDVYPFPGAPPF